MLSSTWWASARLRSLLPYLTLTVDHVGCPLLRSSVDCGASQGQQVQTEHFLILTWANPALWYRVTPISFQALRQVQDHDRD